jgi:hypothetical protein
MGYRDTALSNKVFQGTVASFTFDMPERNVTVEAVWEEEILPPTPTPEPTPTPPEEEGNDELEDDPTPEPGEDPGEEEVEEDEPTTESPS